MSFLHRWVYLVLDGPKKGQCLLVCFLGFNIPRKTNMEPEKLPIRCTGLRQGSSGTHRRVWRRCQPKKIWCLFGGEFEALFVGCLLNKTSDCWGSKCGGLKLQAPCSWCFQGSFMNISPWGDDTILTDTFEMG